MSSAQRTKERDPLASFQAKLRDTRYMRSAFNAGNLGNLINEGVAAAMTSDLVDQVRKQHQEIAAELGMTGQAVRDAGEAARAIRMAGRRMGPLYSDTAPGVALDADFDQLGEVFRAAALKNHAKRGRLESVTNAYSSTIGADGGFLIPETLRADLLTLSLEMSIVRRRATVIPMDSARTGIPKTDETTRDGQLFGGWVGSFVQEGQTLPQTQPNLARTVLDAGKLVMTSAAPSELVNDAPAFSALMGTTAPVALAQIEDQGFLTGSGVGEPVGVLTSDNTAMIMIDPAVSAHVSLTDVLNMFCRLLPASIPNAIWVTSAGLLPDLMQLSFRLGTSPLSDVSPGIVTVDASGQLRMLGRPLIVSENAPAAGSDYSLSLMDLRHYLIGDRQTMTISASPAPLWNSDGMTFKIVERVDGQPWVDSPITPANGGATVSPFVALSGTHT